VKALVFEGPGRMPLRDRSDPAPGPGEVVVQVRASGICGSDVHGYTGHTGRRTPGVVMGHEAAGVVTRVGPDVGGVQVGDRVALRSILACGTCDQCLAGRANTCRNRRGLGMAMDGAYAELVVVPEALAVSIPDSVSFTAGALVEPLAVALHAVRATLAGSPERILIVGAGTIGLLVLLALRAEGARRVVVTDRSAHHLDAASRAGADTTVLVSTDDPMPAILEATDGGADVAVDAVGIAAAVRQALVAVRPGGRVVCIGNSDPTVELPLQDLVSREVAIEGSYGFTTEFEGAIDLIAAGRLDPVPLVEHVAPLADGERLFQELASGRLDALKVLLEPGRG
jgi:L-iditol 2-dehydrogenase